MGFGCEVDSVEAVVIVRKSAVKNDSGNPTASKMILYLGDVSGPAFRRDEKTPIVCAWLKDHKVRAAADSGRESCEHTSGGVSPTRRIASADCHNPEWICPDG